jgi:putative membrane protein
MRLSKAALRIGILLLMIAGLTAALARVGPGGIVDVTAIVKRIGYGGLLGYSAYSLATFGLMGGAWMVAAGERIRRLGSFAWARLVRESTADLLPFSQIGGIVVAARIPAERGVQLPIVYASTIVDLATELASQLVFTLFAVAGLGSGLADFGEDGSVRVALLLAAGILIALIILFLCAPRGLGFASALVRQVVPKGAVSIDRTTAALRAIYDQHRRITGTFGLNLTAWLVSAIGAVIVFHLMRVDVRFWTVIALESMIFLIRTVAFAVPGGIGVQEVGYAVIGPLVGIPLDAALALAVAKRVRDVAIGVPALVTWQALEIRSLMVAPRPRRRD